MGEEDRELTIKILEILLSVSRTALDRVPAMFRPPEIQAKLDEAAKLLKRLKAG